MSNHISFCQYYRKITAYRRYIGISVYVLWYAPIWNLFFKVRKNAWTCDVKCCRYSSWIWAFFTIYFSKLNIFGSWTTDWTKQATECFFTGFFFYKFLLVIAIVLTLLTNLVVHECVESLPVALYLGGDVLVLQDHASCSALPPLCRKIQSIANVWHMAFWKICTSYTLSNVHCLSSTVPSCCRWGFVFLVYCVVLIFETPQVVRRSSENVTETASCTFPPDN